MTSPLLSVIVPVWNDGKRIALCIEALIAQTLSSSAYEIIVVDNGSTDATGEVLATHSEVGSIVKLYEPEPGSYAARNAALAKARGTYIAFTDSDCVPEPDWLETGLAAIEDDPEIGVVAGRVKFMPPDGNHSRACRNYERTLSMRQDRATRKGHAITANWFCRKQTLLDHGGFDQRLKSGADYELSKKISDSGLKVIYCNSAVIRHPLRASLDELTAKIRRVVGGKWAAQSGSDRLWSRYKAECRNARDRSKLLLEENELSVIEKLEALFLVGRVWAISVVELVRLELGHQPSRK